MRGYAKRLDWRKEDKEIISTVLFLTEVSKDPNDPKSWVNPYKAHSFDGYMEKFAAAASGRSGDNETKENSATAGNSRDAAERKLILRNSGLSQSVSDEPTGTMALKVSEEGKTAVFGSKEALALCFPDVVDHIISNLPTFTDNLRVPEPTSSMSITCGHAMMVPLFTQMGRLNDNYRLPTFLNLQSDYVCDFGAAKQLDKITSSFASHVINVAVTLHERSRHLLLGLSLGKDAYKFGKGRIKYNLTSLKAKKEKSSIVNAISYYFTNEVALHFLMLVQPMPNPGEMDPKHPGSCEEP